MRRKWALFSQKLAGMKEKSLVNPMIYKTLAFFLSPFGVCSVGTEGFEPPTLWV